MSHTTTIGQIVFADQNALRSAAQELKQRGIDCDLIENAIPRAYYTEQRGMGQAPLVLKLHQSPYDVGFYPNQDGELEARCDLYQGHIERQLGVAPEEGLTRNQQAIGKLRAAYSLHACTNTVVQGGGTVMPRLNDNGSVDMVARVRVAA